MLKLVGKWPMAIISSTGLPYSNCAIHSVTHNNSDLIDIANCCYPNNIASYISNICMCVHE